MTIYTHVNPDPDAVFSVALLQLLNPEYAEADIQLVSGSWDGEGFSEGDMALDIRAGGKGFKGEVEQDTGRVRSAFYGVLQQYGSADDQAVFAPIAHFIDETDSRGSIGFAQLMIPDDVEKQLVFLDLPMLDALMGAWKALYGPDDFRVFASAREFLDGYRRDRLAELADYKKAAEDSQYFAGGRIVYTTGVLNDRRRRYYYRKGVEWVVYDYDNCLGVKRTEGVTLRADHPDLQAVVAKYGEQDEWFAHSAGFLYCRGSTKAPVATPSKVDPMELVGVLEKLIHT